MTGTNQLRRSRTRLQRQGALWFQQTRTAGATFLEEAQDFLAFGNRVSGLAVKVKDAFKLHVHDRLFIVFVAISLVPLPLLGLQPTQKPRRYIRLMR